MTSSPDVDFFFVVTGKPTTLAYGGKLKGLLPEPVVSERTPRHDSQANPAERADRTLEETSQSGSSKLMFVAVAECGIVVPGGMLNEPVENENDDKETCVILTVFWLQWRVTGRWSSACDAC